jgi:hypothetical protein
LNNIVGYELYKTFHTYYPIVFSVNYTKEGKQYAFMTYGQFTKDSKGLINGAHVIKQMVLINGLPFEIKSIYGLSMGDASSGDRVAVEG